MTFVTLSEWRRVLDTAMTCGLLREVDPDDLLPHLRVPGGLSAEEADIVRAKVGTENRMACLEKFVRTHPSLVEALRSGLQAVCPPLVGIVDEAIAEQHRVVRQPHDVDNFLAALRQLDADIEDLAIWALPSLLAAGCITRAERDRVESGRERLAEVIAAKTPSEWRRLLVVLRDTHSDAFRLLSAAFEPSPAPDTAPMPPADAEAMVSALERTVEEQRQTIQALEQSTADLKLAKKRLEERLQTAEEMISEILAQQETEREKTQKEQQEEEQEEEEKLKLTTRSGPIAVPRLLYVRNCVRNLSRGWGEDLKMCPPLTNPVTVDAVAAAVAEELGMESRCLLLK